MSHLRLLVVWLLLATLPLQGFAARSLLFCLQPPGNSHQQSAPAGHHHHAEPGQAHASTEEPDAATAAAHECGACAACCHAVAAVQSALSGTDSLPRATGSPEPHLRIASPASRRPDKPPRG